MMDSNPSMNNNSNTQNNSPDDEAHEMLMRLQNQFGYMDMDLAEMLDIQGKPADNEGHRHLEHSVSSSSSSAMEDPSPEELLAWQEAQFQKGRQIQEQKQTEQEAKLQDAIRKRRQRAMMGNASPDADDGDWEKVPGIPNLNGETSAFFPPTTDEQGNSVPHPILQTLATEGDPEVLGTLWKRLYSSSEGDGLSFHNLVSVIQGYPGPTLLLMAATPSARKSTASLNPQDAQSPSTTNIAFFTTSPWTISPFFTGSNDCFLCAFQDSDVTFWRPRSKNQQQQEQNQGYMYLHPSYAMASASSTSATDPVQKGKRRVRTTNLGGSNGSVYGLGVGGNPTAPRLHLTETLEDCRVMDYCSLFEPGDLMLGQGRDCLNYFDVDCLEVWAVGGEEWIHESLEVHRTQMDIAVASLQKARTVDKKQFLSDLQGGLLTGTPTGLFAHKAGPTERCDV
eukprot:Nitzschia sp. Nitz4//scaffold103_size77763//32368//33720//NITZ4_005442-RA/size77763-processed-gene-0.22-mRNA-1//-1//CDS//3329532319//4975//frame0